MIVELKNKHWALFAALTVTQLVGWWITLARSPYGPAVRDFFTRGGWFGLFIPLTWLIGSAFATTVIFAKLMQVFIEKRPER